MLFVAYIYIRDINNNNSVVESNGVCEKKTYFYSYLFDERIKQKIYYNVYNVS